jgi:hypothetical protein
MITLFGSKKRKKEAKSLELREEIRDLESDLRIVEGRISRVEYLFKEAHRNFEIALRELKRSGDPIAQTDVDHYENMKINEVSRLKKLKKKKEEIEREISQRRTELANLYR